MQAVAKVHMIREVLRDAVEDEIRDFLIDREARGLSPHTLKWYDQQLGHLREYLETRGVGSIRDLTPSLLRSFLVGFRQTHNPGGAHGVYRAIRALLNWYADENEGWKNPILKVAPPKVPEEPLEPVSLDALRAMLETCERRSFTGERDKAVMLFLLDSGCRRAEFCNLNVGDINLQTGAVMVRHGKGNKPRVTFIGAKTRRALIAYLKHRKEFTDDSPLWIDETGKRLTHMALRSLLIRRAKKAGVPSPSIHSFRRGFAITSLRNGCDLLTLQRLLGHSSLAVVSRYLKQVESDLRDAHEQTGPVDNAL